jgi:hypothetical protein
MMDGDARSRPYRPPHREEGPTSSVPAQGDVAPRVIKPLKWLVADLLAAHLDDVFDAAGASLTRLPLDVKAALLGVARRKVGPGRWCPPRRRCPTRVFIRRFKSNCMASYDVARATSAWP